MKEGKSDRSRAIRMSVASGCCRPGFLPCRQNLKVRGPRVERLSPGLSANLANPKASVFRTRDQDWRPIFGLLRRFGAGFAADFISPCDLRACL